MIETTSARRARAHDEARGVEGGRAAAARHFECSASTRTEVRPKCSSFASAMAPQVLQAQPARWQTLEETPEICARRGSNIYPFPGCRWGKEPPSTTAGFVVPAGRVSWAASMLSLANLSAPLDGLEIGACGAPIRMPSGVRMMSRSRGMPTLAAIRAPRSARYYSGENS